MRCDICHDLIDPIEGDERTVLAIKVEWPDESKDKAGLDLCGDCPEAMAVTASARKNPKDAGDRAESNVIGLVDELEPVGDGIAYWHDARTTTMLSWRPTLPVVGCAVIRAGTAVEIKSTMVCYGQRSDNGRFYLPRKQHDRLLEAGGVYLFAVCEPTPDRDVLALKAIPADHVAALVPGWIDVGDDRPEGGYAQMTWSRLFSEQEVGERV